MGRVLYARQKNIKQRGKFKENRYMYCLLVPAVISTIVFGYLPLMGIIMAFKDYDVIMGFGASPWVGFKNFIEIFTAPNFLKAIKNTLIYSSVCLFGQFPFPIMLAVMINEIWSTKYKKVVQTITYLPHFLSWATVVGLAYGMFALRGSVNDFFAMLMGDSYERVNILLDSKNFLGILFFSGLWKDVGWNSVLFLAAIAGIDPTLYEAASCDGANRWKQIWKITIPSIMPTVVIVLIMNMGSLVTNNFEQVYGFQNVFTQEQTEVIGTLAYRVGIQNGSYSLATAFSCTQGIVSFALINIANFISKKASNISIW